MFLGLLAVVSVPALPCTCVSAVSSTAKTARNDDPVVFRGAVIERKLLPQRIEMKGRRRYAITFRVDEYWKGSPDRTLVLYGVDDGTDCLGMAAMQSERTISFTLKSRSSKMKFWMVSFGLVGQMCYPKENTC